jgi:mannitol/fructose-specific phosphotransferase system IIA component (Ntr-type)
VEDIIMRLTDFLSTPVIKVPLEGATKKDVVRELVDLVCRDADGAAAELVFQSVMERERLMSSGIGQGIALPHGFSPSSLSFGAALGIPLRPLEFDAIDRQPVTLIFLVVSDDAHTNTKLKALARISRLLHRQEFREALAASTSVDEAMQVIVDEEDRHRI